jgi:bacillithiol biosynthesis deacetylase BshB1
VVLDVLAIGSHPDDVELFCGGTVSGLTRKGYNVGIADLTAGELATRGSKNQRLEEAEAARQALSVPIRINLGLADGDVRITADHVLKVIAVLRQHRPRWVLCPWHWDRHPDHQDAYYLVRKAAFQSGLRKIETGVEPFRPEGLLFYPCHWVPQPSFVVDISDDMEAKYRAIACYRTQFSRKDSHEPETYISRPSFLEDMKTRDRYWGTQIGTDAGEPWIVERPMGTSDPIAWMESVSQRTQ